MYKTIIRTIVCVAVACVAVWAQANGTLSGKITAAGGAAVANAAVSVTNVTTNTSQRVLTGPDGTFTVSGLAPGTYRVEVESAGYKRVSQQNVELTVGNPGNVTIVLEAGSMNETVEIKGHSPMVQDDSGEMAMGLNSRTVRELPVIDRNHQELVGLMSGVTTPQTFFRPVEDPDRNRYWSTNGQSPWQNYHSLDGSSNWEPWKGSAIRVVPMEMVQQSNMVTSAHSVERGYTGGTWHNDWSRPGTNPWHGSLFEFHSDNNLRARNFFDVAGVGEPKFVYNQFGGSVGGSVVPDRVFLFGSYEGTYNRGANTMLGTVPTANFAAGNFAGIAGVSIFNPATGAATGTGRTVFAGNVIPANRINPMSAAIAAALPSPNLPGFVNNYSANVPMRNDGNKADGRVDFHVSDRTSAFLRYGYTNYLTTEGSLLGPVVGTNLRDRLVAQNAIVSATHSFTGSALTDLRLSYNRYNMRLGNNADASSITDRFGVFFAGLPSISIAGLGTLGTPANVPMNGVDNTFEISNSWNVHTSSHQFKLGFDLQQYRASGWINPLFGSRGGAVFGPGATSLFGGPTLGANSLFANSFASFLLGTPTVTGNNFFAQNPTYRQQQYSAWIGDTITLAKVVTLDFGVRYDLFSPVHAGRAGEAQYYNPFNNTLSFNGIGDVNRYGGQTWDTDAIGPRAGIAIRITPKTVFRGGWGMNFIQTPFMWSGLTPTGVSSQTGVFNGFGVAGNFTLTPPNAPSSFATPVSGAVATNGAMTYVPSSQETPYIQTYNAQLQQEFGNGIMLSLGYVGSRGFHLPYITEMNAALPGRGTSGLPLARFGRTSSVAMFSNDATNNYNSLQVNLTKRFAAGLAFQAAYTYSRALDYGSDFGTMLTSLNPFDRGANYGPSDFDRRHLLTISHLWMLPFGAGTHYLNHGWVGQVLGNWQLNGIFRWSSGTPFTVYANGLGCNCPGAAVLANVNGPVEFSSNIGIGQTFFNTGAFSTPASGTFGNQGRNMFRGPGFRNYDLSLFRSFVVKENWKLELRGEAYNLTNTPHFANPQYNFSAADFGQVTSYSNGAMGRQLTVAARLLF